MKRFRHKASFGLALCVLLSSTLSSAGADNPPEQNVVPSGYDDYVSAHQYISRTDDPDVYKVTLSLELSQKNVVTTDVVIHANLGHMYYEDNNDLQPIAMPDGSTATKVYQLEKYTAQTLVEMLCDPIVNPNYANTRIGLTASAVNNGTNATQLRDISDAWFLSDLVGPDNKQDLLDAIEIYNPSPYRGNTTGTGVVKNGKGGSNKYADAKGLQRAYQLLTDQPLYFQPIGAITDGSYTSPSENVAETWTFTRPNGNTVAANAATPMWFENPTVAGKSNIKHQKFIIWLGAGLMGGNGDQTPWNNPKPNAASYAIISDPIGTLDLTNDVANNPYSHSDAPIYQTVDEGAKYFHYHRAHKWTRYHTQAISTLLDQQSDNDQMRNMQMLALWPYGVATGWQGYNNLRMDFLETITTDGSYVPFSPGRGYATHYYQMRTAPGYVHQSSAVSTRVQYYDHFGGTNNWGNWGDLHIIESAADLQSTIERIVAGIVPSVTLDSKFHLSQNFDFVDAYGIQSSQGTVDQNGRDISWVLPDVNSGTFTLTFYVRANRGEMQNDLHYPVLDTAYVRYDRRPIPELGESGASRPVLLHFPTAYISANGIENPDESPSLPSSGGDGGNGTVNSSTSGDGSNLMPLFAIPYGQSKVYTPSVTPNKQQVAEANLQEREPAKEEPIIESENIADAADEVEVMAVANTATTSRMLVALLASAILLTLLVLGRKSILRRRG